MRLSRREFLATSFAAGAVAHAGAVTELAHASPRGFNALTDRGLCVAESLEWLLQAVRDGLQVYDLYEGGITLDFKTAAHNEASRAVGCSFHIERGREVEGFTA